MEGNAKTIIKLNEIGHKVVKIFIHFIHFQVFECKHKN